MRTLTPQEVAIILEDSCRSRACDFVWEHLGDAICECDYDRVDAILHFCKPERMTVAACEAVLAVTADSLCFLKNYSTFKNRFECHLMERM